MILLLLLSGIENKSVSIEIYALIDFYKDSAIVHLRKNPHRFKDNKTIMAYTYVYMHLFIYQSYTINFWCLTF